MPDPGPERRYRWGKHDLWSEQNFQLDWYLLHSGDDNVELSDYRHVRRSIVIVQDRDDDQSELV